MILITRSNEKRGDFMSTTDISTWAFQIYADMLQVALPVAIAFGVSNLCVNIFLSAAFGGKIKIGGVK